jgi:hypothetical protein
MDVTNIEPMEWNTARGAGVALGARLSVLLGLGELGDDGDAFQFLSRQLNCEWNGLLVEEFNVANAGRKLVN